MKREIPIPIKKTGRTREVVHNNLSVKTGEKSHITLFRPMMVEMIPVLDENGNQVKNGKGNPKYKRLSEATPEEKALKKEGKLKSRFFQERDSNTGLAKFATYKVFELSQTTLKPEFYPKAMPIVTITLIWIIFVQKRCSKGFQTMLRVLG